MCKSTVSSCINKNKKKFDGGLLFYVPERFEKSLGCLLKARPWRCLDSCFVLSPPGRFDHALPQEGSGNSAWLLDLQEVTGMLF